MALHQSTQKPAWWLLPFAGVGMLVFLFGQLTSRVHGGEDAAAPYDRLYDVIMTRFGPDSKAYGANESSPSIFKESDFPFDDKTFEKFNAALDAFGALPQK